MPTSISAVAGTRRAPHHPSRTVARAAMGTGLAPAVAALFVAGAVAFVLPAPVFRAAAIVAPDGGVAKGVSEQRRLVELASSRPVLRAAAIDLVARDVHPVSGVMERLAPHRLDGEGDRVARLLDQLAGAAEIVAVGDVLSIGAEAGEPVRAARIAQALADSFLRKRAEAAAAAQRGRESELVARIAAAETAAGAARRRFRAAGGADAEVVAARAAAATEVRQADARVADLQTILASGSPPIGDDAAATQAVGDIQANYLDLRDKLAQALQTLGERHTTVITLRESIRRAASDLTAAWTRQLRSAEAERDAAKARAAALFRADPGRDEAKRAALDEARRVKEAADAALLRAEAELDFLPEQGGFVLRTAAAIPTAAAAGWSPAQRGAAAIGSWLAAFALLAGGRVALRRRDGSPRRSGAMTGGAAATTTGGWVAANDSAPPLLPSIVETSAGESTASGVRDALLTSVPAEPAGQAMAASGDATASDVDGPTRFFRGAAPSLVQGHAAAAEGEPAAMAGAGGMRDLLRRFRAIVEDLRNIEPSCGPIPTLMVAGVPQARRLIDRGGTSDADGSVTDTSIETAAVSLALAGIAAAAGLRVLLIEAVRGGCISLADHVAAEACAVTLGMRDGVRLVFAADAVPGLSIAPLFERRAELVAALSRHRDARRIGDVAAHYDLLLINAGDAAATARAAWAADRYLAVGADAAPAAHARYLAALGFGADRFAGSVVDAVFMPAAEAPQLRPLAASAIAA